MTDTKISEYEPSHTCPNCGYCPTCGRRYPQPYFPPYYVPSYPWGQYKPWWGAQPTITCNASAETPSGVFRNTAGGSYA